ncbi:MAG: hypothetical protein AAGA46_08730 [Cyanobacteria bacterium P01_F01_bin.13]
MPDINRAQVKELLHHYLSQCPAGIKLLKSFEANPEVGGPALADYLHTQLLQDEDVANQLILALGEEDGQFNTIVTKSQVDQIINVAQPGVLNLEINKQVSPFRNVRQLIIFLLSIVFCGLTAAFTMWVLSQPRRMDGDFNIAVAEFLEVPEGNESQLTSLASQFLFSSLDTEYQLVDFGISIEVLHNKIGSVSDAAAAARIAQKINADIVIYGDITLIDGIATMLPRFYIHEDFRSDLGEMTGQHQLALPIEFQATSIGHFNSDVNQTVRQRLSILLEFTKALVFLEAEEFKDAFKSINRAIQSANKYGDFAGKEVLYLFASRITLDMENSEIAQEYIDKALELNESYARAYIGQANVFYSKYDFTKALHFFEHADQLADQPYGAHINEKVKVGKGNIYVYMYQISKNPEKEQFAKSALSAHHSVIQAYHQTSNANLRELAALSYYGSAIVLQGQTRIDKAIKYYEKVLSVSTKPSLIEKAETRLAQIGQ